MEWPISVEMTFNASDFNQWVDYILPYALHLAIINLVMLAVVTFIRAYFMTWYWRIFAFISVAVSIAFCIVIVVVNIPTFNSISRGIQWKIYFWNDHTSGLAESLRPYRLAHSYGLFRSMTGVGGRPEVVLEASHNGKDWEEIHFMYKPTDLNQSLPFLIPHQPRLDWQMWFAALRSQPKPWLNNLALRILQQSEDVLALLDQSRWPFRDKAPVYIRANHYKYFFQDPWLETSTKVWRRTFNRRHFEAVGESILQRYMREPVESAFPDSDYEDSWWYKVITLIRAELRTRRPEHTMWGIALALLLIQMAKYILL